MKRLPSDSSTASTSALRRFGSRLRRLGSTVEREPVSPISITPPVQKFVQELDATETETAHPRESIGNAPDDPSSQELRDNIRRLKERSFGVNGIGSTYAAYSRFREQSLELCKSLAKKSNDLSAAGMPGRTLEAASDANENTHSVLLGAVLEFKEYQEELLENVRKSLLSSYRKYVPEATEHQFQMFLENGSLQRLAVWEIEASDVFSSNYPPMFEERLANYDQLKIDLLQIEKLCAARMVSRGSSVAAREYDIAVNGDTILEFTPSEIDPVLRFRVSSHMLIEASPFFARMMLPSDSVHPLEMLEGYPPPPRKQRCQDGTEVKVYRMPQFELNKWESLTTLLHAAHMHYDQIPREVKFREFVSIAEVCLRYQCSSPLEMAVEYRWLPQWLHKATEDSPDGFLLISYVFGLRLLFTKTSKLAILNLKSSNELEGMDLWPQIVKSKIGAVREAKFAQIYAVCANLIRDYLKPTPIVNVDDKTGEVTFKSEVKCPRGMRQCDATNLGWLMLVYNELGILSIVMDIINKQETVVKSSRSINSLVSGLRRMPSAPQLHSGICDYATSLRSSVNDIYNSIVGLTLRDISGIDGWALSRQHDAQARFGDEAMREIFELPAEVGLRKPDQAAASDENISLRILSFLDNLQDLHAAAMTNKSFYNVYKKHELALMRRLVKAGKRPASPPSPSAAIASSAFSITPPRPKPEPFLSVRTSSINDCDAERSVSPLDSYLDSHLSEDEVENILWPKKEAEKQDNATAVHIKLDGYLDLRGLRSESNAKFLPGDRAHIDKSLVVEGRKHLREEHDRNLRMAPRSSVSQAS